MNRLTTLSILALALLLSAVTIFGERGLILLLSIDREISALSRKNASINAEMVELENKLYAVANDRNHLERLAREELGLSRPGEVIYTFPKDFSAADRAPAGKEAGILENMDHRLTHAR